VAKTSYKLSDIAEDDISAIFDYTATHYGRDQAIRYLTGIDDRLNFLLAHPEIGKERPDIRQGLRSLIYEHHIIFYRHQSDYLRIIRVLHESSDMPRFLRDG